MNLQSKTDKVKVHTYNAIKFNKHSTIFECQTSTANSFLTTLIKIESFQGFSKTFNAPFYLRVKDKSSWTKSSQITGLFKSGLKGLFYGDKRTIKGKTLILFKLTPDNEVLTVYTYPEGYYPIKTTIDKLLSEVI